MNSDILLLVIPLAMFLLVLRFLPLLVQKMAAPSTRQFLVVEVVVGMITWPVSDIPDRWLLPDSIAAAPTVLKARLLNAFDIEAAVPGSEDVGVDERIGEALAHWFAMPAPTIAVAH